MLLYCVCFIVVVHQRGGLYYKGPLWHNDSTVPEPHILDQTSNAMQIIVCVLSRRLVRMGSSPEDQIILTIVANSSTTEGIMEDLWVELNRLTGKFQCQFSHLRRYGEKVADQYFLCSCNHIVFASTTF